jgi:hypothetical protein
VEHRITGFPVIDDDWKLVNCSPFHKFPNIICICSLKEIYMTSMESFNFFSLMQVGVVSDYDLLALDSISG